MDEAELKQKMIDAIEKASNLLHAPIAMMPEPIKAVHEGATEIWMSEFYEPIMEACGF